MQLEKYSRNKQRTKEIKTKLSKRNEGFETRESKFNTPQHGGDHNEANLTEGQTDAGEADVFPPL